MDLERLEYDEKLHKCYREIIDKPDLERIVLWAAGMKHIRERVNNPVTSQSPLHVVCEDELLLENSFMSMAKLLKAYISRGVFTGEMANHFRVYVPLHDDSYFEELYMRELHDLRPVVERSQDFLRIGGFVVEKPLAENSILAPVVYIRPSYACDEPTFLHILRHEDSHAFSMGFMPPEKLYGYWPYDDGEGEVLVRDLADEFIANIESDELLQISHKPSVYVCGTQYGFQRYKKMCSATINIVTEARERIHHPYDLANLLRIIPVQTIEKVLPNVVFYYQQKEYNKLRDGIPIPFFHDK